MLLERYYEDSLAQATYLIGCERTREAILIDPNVRHRGLAPPRGMKIRYVTETHIHADFLSGSRQVAAACRAELLLSGHGGADWSYREGDAHGGGVRLLRDGDTITVGRVRLDVMHTPGHTPEHIAFLVTDTAAGDRPMGLVSGDFLFVGDVGRPDLLEKAAKVAGSMDAAARQLYASLRRLKALPEYLQVWPGHGAGSACGKSLGAVPQTTLGYERLYNPALQFDDEDAFVHWVLADQPDAPPYFAVMKRRNRDGWSGAGAEPATIDAPQLRARIAEGDQVVDVRGSRDYGTRHVPGTINIPAGNSLVTYAGTVLRYDTPVVLVAASAEVAHRVIAQLSLIGIAVAAYATREALDALLAERSSSFTPRDVRELAGGARPRGARLLDVRGTTEWRDGHIPDATHVYLGDVAAWARGADRDAPVIVHCQSGSRSSIAASMLEARGFTAVSTFPGGFDAWRKAGLPVEEGP